MRALLTAAVIFINAGIVVLIASWGDSSGVVGYVIGSLSATFWFIFYLIYLERTR